MKNPNSENTQHHTQDVSRPVLEMSSLVADFERQAERPQRQKGTSLSGGQRTRKVQRPPPRFHRPGTHHDSRGARKIRPLRQRHDDRSRPCRHPRNLPRQLHGRRSMAAESDPRPLRQPLRRRRFRWRRRQISPHGGARMSRSRCDRVPPLSKPLSRATNQRTGLDVPLWPAHPKSLRKVQEGAERAPGSAEKPSRQPNWKKPACSSNWLIHRA